MDDRDRLHARLDALNARIEARRTRLRELDEWTDGHHLTSGELLARYRYLKEKVDADIRDLDVHGHHVSGLEASVMAWVKGIP
jgi:hypothetical protein